MKKISILVILSLFLSALYAQIPLSVSGSYYIETKNLQGIDQIIIFKTIDATSTITYTGGKTPVYWHSYDGTLVQSGTPELYPEDAEGYILTAGSGTNKDSLTLYIIDHSIHRPLFNTLTINEDFEGLCEETQLLLDADATELSYVSPNGTTHNLKQQYLLTYTTLIWQDDNWQETVKDTIVNAETNLYVPAPLTNTTFKITEHSYVEELGITDKINTESSLYQAVAIDIHPISLTEIRTATNEIDRPSESNIIKGSAPLVIQFLANANAPIAQYYKWEIKRGNELLVQRSDREHRYSFENAGIYNISLTVSNAAGCKDTASFEVQVSESFLQVPNVFTPNGDGKNDEFRVAYKSLLEFEGHIYNRWGRRVFSWNDPAKGWDGTINGRPASPGVYFYVIQAKGSDGVVYRAKDYTGDVTLTGR